MTMGALHSLQISHLTPTTYQGLNLYKIQVYAETRDKYYTFCTPECANAIQDYLNYRRRSNEEIKDKAPLIREQFNKDNPFTSNSPRFVSEKGIEHLIDNILAKSGVRKPGIMHLSHGFRKYFMTECERSGMKSINVKMLMGHNIDGTKNRRTSTSCSTRWAQYIHLVSTIATRIIQLRENFECLNTRNSIFK
jgi:site-specific recombinase XerD